MVIVGQVSRKLPSIYDLNVSFIQLNILPQRCGLVVSTLHTPLLFRHHRFHSESRDLPFSSHRNQLDMELLELPIAYLQSVVSEAEWSV